MKRLIPLIVAPIVFAAVLAPASAQDDDTEKVNTVIIYGDDPCLQSSPDEIIVCARLAESERYRIPENLRQSGDPENEAWASRVQSYEAVGDFGPLSCTPVGAGGELGCTARVIETAFAERAQGSEVRFSQLIAEARAERLATIDEEAAATQARVEEMERERLAKDDGETPPPERSLDPVPVDPADLPPAN